MTAELVPKITEGLVIKDGVAQQVARADGLTAITLTVMAGHPARHLAEGQSADIAFCWPVVIPAGESAAILIEWADDLPDYAPPVRMPVDTVLRAAHIRR